MNGGLSYFIISLFPSFIYLNVLDSLQTTFINTIDAPSLALLVPIVHRGLRERSAETKKKAAQIVGNMCSLVTEPKDMIPYIGLLLPEVKKVPCFKSGMFDSSIELFSKYLFAPKLGSCGSNSRSSVSCSKGPWIPYKGNGRRSFPRSRSMVV